MMNLAVGLLFMGLFAGLGITNVFLLALAVYLGYLAYAVLHTAATNPRATLKWGLIGAPVVAVLAYGTPGLAVLTVAAMVSCILLRASYRAVVEAL